METVATHVHRTIIFISVKLLKNGHIFQSSLSMKLRMSAPGEAAGEEEALLFAQDQLKMSFK